MSCQSRRGDGNICLGFHEPKFLFCTEIVSWQTETATSLSDHPRNQSDLLCVSNVQFLSGLAVPTLVGLCRHTVPCAPGEKLGALGRCWANCSCAACSCAAPR